MSILKPLCLAAALSAAAACAARADAHATSGVPGNFAAISVAVCSAASPWPSSS